MDCQKVLLLTQIDRESLKLQEYFSTNGKHLNLDDFASAISAFDGLEAMLNTNSNLSEIEAGIIGTFYSALAFRMIDTSTEFDETKFDKAKEIIERAEKITMASEPSVFKAKQHLERKLSKLAPEKIEGIISHLEKYTSAGKRFYLNDYAYLGFDTKRISRLAYFHMNSNYRQDGWYKRIIKGAKLYANFCSEVIISGIFFYLGISGIYHLSNGNYKTGTIEVGIAIGIPLTRYFYRERKIEDILGYDYQMPKLKPVSLNKT